MSSKIFKAGYVNPSKETKIIEAKPIAFKSIKVDNDKSNEAETKESQLMEIPKEVLEMIENAKKEADEVIQSANKKAAELKQITEQENQKIIDELEIKASQLLESSKEEGFHTGHEEGYRAGEKLAHEDYRTRIEEVNQIFDHANNRKIEELMEAKELIINLAYKIACKVVLNNPEVLKDQIVDLVSRSLEKVRDTEKIEINVNPNDFNIVNEALPLFKNMISGKAEIVIRIESHIEIGSCLLHTSMGTIDARVTTQLEELKKALQTLAIGSECLDEA